MQIGEGRTLKGLLLQMKLGQTSEERILAEECIEIAFDEIVESLSDCFNQACREDKGEQNPKYDHMCLSAYENAQDLLIKLGKIKEEECSRK